MPTIAVEIISLTQNPDVDFDELAGVIQLDPALSSNILRTVNSSFYGQVRTIGTLNRALTVLGLGAVKALALGFTLVYCPRVLGQWFDGIRFYAAASSPRRSRRTWAGLR